MGVLDDMPGVRREAVPGPDGYSGCDLERPEWTKQQRDHLKTLFDGTSDHYFAQRDKPEWTKPAVQMKDSLDEHRDFRIRQLLIRFNNPTGLVGLLETIATVFTDLTDRVDVLEMELNRLKRAKQ
jgi:hypothetical protein